MPPDPHTAAVLLRATGSRHSENSSLGREKTAGTALRGESMMKRLSLLLILLLAAAFVDPRLRARAAPHARPVIQWALDPVYEWSTSYRLAEIARGISEHMARNNPVPAGAEFSAYLRDYYRSDTADIDSWGSAFFLGAVGSEIRVFSAGPDRRAGTDDDIRSRPLNPQVR